MTIDGQVVRCDIRGCREKLIFPPDVHPAQAVEDNPEWTTVEGRHRCPRHSGQRPWLS